MHHEEIILFYTLIVSAFLSQIRFRYFSIHFPFQCVGPHFVLIIRQIAPFILLIFTNAILESTQGNRVLCRIHQFSRLNADNFTGVCRYFFQSGGESAARKEVLLFFFVNVVFVCLFVLFVFFKFHEVSSLGL